MEERPVKSQSYIQLDEDLINSGDYFAVMRLDGLDQIIMYGTGSHSGHSVMALRFDEELYIVESQDSWYWPTAGLQRTKYDTWMKQAQAADFHVTWMPLSADAASKFNAAEAQNWFYKTQGLPYGYHNFLFGWIDTPVDNLPPFLAHEFIPIVFSALEKIVPSVIDTFYTQALNKRTSTQGYSVSQIAGWGATKGLSVQDIMSMPEQDGWEYTGETPRDGESMVCSAYVAAVWKAGGLFDPYNINATEWSPKDVYIVDFFNPEKEMPKECQDANGADIMGYCQVTGKYKMTFPEFSTI